MQYKFFVIPIRDFEEAENELNRFLRSHRILSIQSEFVADGKGSFWAKAVEYLGGGASRVRSRDRIDYQKVLDEHQFTLFSRLREVRKEIADSEGIPVYAIFTNEQLASIVTQKVRTISEMMKIDGIGKGKAEKYADLFLRAVNRSESMQENKGE